MRSITACLINLLVLVSAGTAQSFIKGHVRLADGQSVAGAQVMLFDVADLRRNALVRVTTDADGQFVLPLAGFDKLSPQLGRSSLPNGFALGANYPNPFNPATVIPYELAASAQVRLEVFNLLGQRVATLVDGYQAAGAHTAMWTATDAASRAVSAGVYLYRLTVDSQQQTGRMVLVDGQAGVASAIGPGWQTVAGATDAGERSYGLAVSGVGLVTYVDEAFALESGPVAVVVESAAVQPRGKGLAEGADLVVDSLWVDRSELIQEESFVLNVRVHNQGTAASDSTTVGFYLSNNTTISPADTQMGSAPVGGLASADTSTVSLDLTAPLRVGTHWVGACVETVSGESDAKNNCSAELEITVSPISYSADLVVSAVVRSASAGRSNNIFPQGHSFTLSAMVINQGTAASDSMMVYYYVSADSTIGSDDTELGMEAMGALAVADTSAHSLPLFAPSEAGTYYYGGCVASMADESETDESMADESETDESMADESETDDNCSSGDNARCRV